MRSIAATLVACAVLAAPAHASFSVGQITSPTGTPSGNCGSATHFVQASTGAAPPSYVIPVDGIVTSWSTNAGPLPGQKLRLDVFHPVAGTTYSVVGTSGIQDLTSSAINDSLPARIRVHPGDLLGLSPDPEGSPMSLSGVLCGFNSADASDVVQAGLVPFGATVDLPGTTTKERLNVAATIEPDADGDGFGDESQDACPADAAAHVAPCSSGGTRIGQTAEPNVNCDQATYVPTGVSWGNSYTVPSGGVLTSWQVQAPTGPAADPMSFKVFRPGGTVHQYTVIAESPLINIVGGGIQSFPFRLSVQPGDVIGLYSHGNSGYCGRFTTQMSDAFDFVNVDNLPAGDVHTYNPGVLFRFDLAATVEPDRDNDGFGDLTQDACPNDPARQSCPPATTAAIVSGVRQSASRWRAGGRLPSISRARRTPVGTTFQFALDKAASVRLVFARPKSGRKVRGKCVPPSRTNRTKPRCKRTVTAGTLTLAGHAGVNRVRFQGRLSRRKRLTPGTYTLTITATVAPAVASPPTTLRFTIVK